MHADARRNDAARVAMTSDTGLTRILRRVDDAGSLAAVNAVVEHAVSCWGLSERNLRLSLPSLRYHPHDLEHMNIALLTDSASRPCAVLACEDLATGEGAATDSRTRCIHGLYVAPADQDCGLGRSLVEHASADAIARGQDRLMVRAWRDAVPFFLRLGFEPCDFNPRRSQVLSRLWRTTR